MAAGSVALLICCARGAAAADGVARTADAPVNIIVGALSGCAKSSRVA